MADKIIRGLTVEQSDLLKKIAKEKHMSVNGLLLTLIEQYTKKNKSENTIESFKKAPTSHR